MFGWKRAVIGCLTLSLCLWPMPVQQGNARAEAANYPLQSGPSAPRLTTTPPVQLFDVSRGEVIRTAANSPVFRRMGETWIASIRGAWGGFRLDPTSGFVLKVPLDPPLNVNNGWYRGEVAELYVMWDPAAPHDTRLMLMGRVGNPRMFVIGAEAGSFVEQFRGG
ncbi:hypothetical protein FE783_25855 [Paenibacillus mesophilus]|uniref:hypothetical protein n=1 Tax=Paenibacillus mesophilus TaxID=2582849 RepID=UPI00110DC42F|nr:hypothetical protein [Paenibacillus mesophilus]TMV46397.1 hypothetical protein FE783_25855 [Paenibacillus mesophilus]